VRATDDRRRPTSQTNSRTATCAQGSLVRAGHVAEPAPLDIPATPCIRPRCRGLQVRRYCDARLLAFIAVSAIEITILHLLLPWRTAQRISLALGFYGLFWMVGLLASLRVHPHVVGDSGLRIRYGTTVDITIPWDAIATIRTRSRPLPKGRSIHLDRTGSDPVLYIGILKQINIDVALRHSVTVPLPKP
jgi:hypothetical protein